MQRRAFFIALTLLLALGGCAGLSHVPIPYASELEEFKPASKRIIEAPKIRHEIVDNVAEFCAKLTGQPHPSACAEWNRSKQICTIYTEKTTTNVFIGHEVRHCFEGGFH